MFGQNLPQRPLKAQWHRDLPMPGVFFQRRLCSGGLIAGTCCLANESFQRGVCDSALALRELRLQIIELTGQRDALLAKVRAFGAFEPVHLPGFVPFVGIGHQLDNNMSCVD